MLQAQPARSQLSSIPNIKSDAPEVVAAAVVVMMMMKALVNSSGAASFVSVSK